MKKILKGLVICSCMFLCLGIGINVSAGSDTGHSGFEEIYLEADRDASLLVNMNQSQKQEALKKVKWKLFGYSTSIINYKEPVKYVAQTIFSRANLTSHPIEFEYGVKTGKTVTDSTTVTGSLSVNASGKIKTLALGVKFDMQAIWERIVKETYEETTEFVVKILPGTKVSLRVKGEATMSNGGCKCFAFGITTKKGHWEDIDVKTEYYELYEEKM